MIRGSACNNSDAMIFSKPHENGNRVLTWRATFRLGKDGFSMKDMQRRTSVNTVRSTRRSRRRVLGPGG